MGPASLHAAQIGSKKRTAYFMDGKGYSTRLRWIEGYELTFVTMRPCVARSEVNNDLFIRAELYIVVKGTQREATIHERSFRSVPDGFPIAGYYQPVHGSMVAQGCAEA